MHYRIATPDDIPYIRALYKTVARDDGGIARLEHEVTDEYITDFVHHSLSRGLIIVGQHPENPHEIIAEVHGYRPDIAAFDHVISNLTIAVHPAFQGKKIGRTIFTIFLQEISHNYSSIGKVELMVREGNTKAITFYQSLGFRIEGRMEMRIRTSYGSYEADISMGWQNPNFEF